MLNQYNSVLVAYFPYGVVFLCKKGWLYRVGFASKQTVSLEEMLDRPSMFLCLHY